MPDWLTYRLSDFLMFTPATYYRLFERQNAALWPWPLVAVALGLLLLYLGFKGGRAGSVAVAGLLALLWIFVGWTFHWQRYAGVNLAAPWFAGGFGLEGLGLGICASQIRTGTVTGRRHFPRLGLGLALFGLAVQPLLGQLQHRSWSAVELFGVAPDPTVTVTLGLLLLLGAPAILFVIPLLASVASWATLWAMGRVDGWVVLGVGLVAVAGLAGRSRRSQLETDETVASQQKDRH